MQGNVKSRLVKQPWNRKEAPICTNTTATSSLTLQLKYEKPKNNSKQK
jgi:hypothetical protein